MKLSDVRGMLARFVLVEQFFYEAAHGRLHGRRQAPDPLCHQERLQRVLRERLFKVRIHGLAPKDTPGDPKNRVQCHNYRIAQLMTSSRLCPKMSVERRLGNLVTTPRTVGGDRSEVDFLVPVQELRNIPRGGRKCLSERNFSQGHGPIFRIDDRLRKKFFTRVLHLIRE